MEKIIELIAKIAKKRQEKAYIVGGFLRDRLMKRSTFDVDFVVIGDVEKFSKNLSRKLKASFVNLSKKFGFYRVISNEVQIDFARLRGRDLKNDLKLRDFTINSLASDVNESEQLIDINNGVKDIRKKVIRETNKKVFIQDPLRMVRAIRFVAVLKFNIASSTRKLIKKHKVLLKYVSRERIRDELFKILEVDNPIKYIKLMDKFKILEVLFPEIIAMKRIRQSGNHHLDVWNHSLETVKLLDESIEKIKTLNNGLKNDITKYINEEITRGRRRIEIIKFACLFHDIAKPEVRAVIDGRIKFLRHESLGSDKIAKIGKNIKLSRDEIKFLRTLVASHLRVGNLSCSKKITKRAVSRFIFDIGKDVFGVLIISLADRLAARGELVDDKVIARHIEVSKRILFAYKQHIINSNLPKLISGTDLINKFGLKEGPLIGEILKKIRESQVSGSVSTRSQALSLAKLLICSRRS